MESSQFKYRRHLSPYLQYKWKYNNFKIKSFHLITDNTFEIIFQPKNRLLLPFMEFISRKKNGFAVSAIVSTRLSFIASIVAAGKFLNKDKKNGEVITSEFHLHCDKPIFYKANSVNNA